MFQQSFTNPITTKLGMTIWSSTVNFPFKHLKYCRNYQKIWFFFQYYHRRKYNHQPSRLISYGIWISECLQDNQRQETKISSILCPLWRHFWFKKVSAIKYWDISWSNFNNSEPESIIINSTSTVTPILDLSNRIVPHLPSNWLQNNELLMSWWLYIK